MHISALGLELRANASALMEMAREGRWGRYRGEFKVRYGIALERAWNEFKGHCSAHGLEHSQPQFTTVTLGMADGAQSLPELKPKARNSMHVT